MKTIGIIGLGTMGQQIAAQAAIKGVDVIALVKPGTEANKLESVRAIIQKRAGKLELQAGQASEALWRVKVASNYAALNDVDLVIEAVPERMEIKSAILAEAANRLPKNIPFASNTSSLSITTLGRQAGIPDRVVGLHLFNPVDRMQLAEIAAGINTSQETIAAAAEFATRIGKTVLHVGDMPGFVVNRLLMSLLAEAIRLFDCTHTKPEVIDEAMILGCNHPMGPLKLADWIGLDVVESILIELHQSGCGEHYRPPHVLRRLVEGQRLGRKTGRGFYEYEDEPKERPWTLKRNYPAIDLTNLYCNFD